MSLLRSPKLRSIRSRLASIRDRFGGKPRKTAGQLKPRSLCMDPLEDRLLLSVTAADWDDVLVNQTVSTTPQVTVDGQSIAVDDDGDFVVAWTRYDGVFDPMTGAPVIDPATGDPMLDANIYARYFTDEVQQLTLPDAVVEDLDGTPENGAGSFTLRYGGNELQKISVTATWQPFAYDFQQQPIAGSVTYGFDVNGNGIVGPGETATVFFDEGAQDFTEIANNFEITLQGLGGALTDAEVTGLNPHEYMVQFGDISLGEDQPEITVESVNFTSGFLPAVLTSTVREPIDIGPILVHPTDPFQTANAIEQWFLHRTSDDYAMGPIYFPPEEAGRVPSGIEGPYWYPDSLRTAAPGVSVTPLEMLDPGDPDDPTDHFTVWSTTTFEITFDGSLGVKEGTAGKKDHPELVVAEASNEDGENWDDLNGNGVKDAGEPFFSELSDIDTLKEPSPEFRVNPAEPDNPFTPLPDRLDQTRPAVAMDGSGGFVITWEGIVPDLVDFGSVADVFARRFTPSGVVDAADVPFYVDMDFDGVPETPIQGVRALVTPEAEYVQRLTFDAVGPGVLTGPFQLEIDGAATAQINFDSTEMEAVAAVIESQLGELSDGRYRDVRVDVVAASDPYQFEVRLKTTIHRNLDEADAAVRPTISIVADPGSLPATVGADYYGEQQVDEDKYTFQVNTETTNAQGEPHVALDEDGDFVITWASGAQDLSFFESVWARRYDRSGAALDLPFMVNTEDTSFHVWPYVALSHDGHFVVTWTHTADADYIAGDGFAADVRGKLYDPDGAVLLPQFFVGGGGGSTAAFDMNNNFLVSWHVLADTDNIPTSGGYRSGVRAVMRALDGTVIRDQFRANSASMDPGSNTLWPNWQFNAQAVIDADGDLVISYEGFAPDVSEDVWSQSDPTGLFQQFLIDRFYKPENADLLQFFDPAETNFSAGNNGTLPISPFYVDSGFNFVFAGSNGDVDGTIDQVLIRAMTQAGTQANDAQLGRIRALIDEVAGLLRGEDEAVMFSRFDADPSMEFTALFSDSIANAHRDGHNRRYILTVPTTSEGGNFVIRMWHQGSAGWEDITVSPVYNNSVLNVGRTREAIENALRGASRTGVNWPELPWDEGPVEVRTVSSGFGFINSEITVRQGTPWEYTVSADEAVYEITFQGEVHDEWLWMSLWDNNLTPDPQPSPRLVVHTYEDEGTRQGNASIAMEPDGDFVTVWTQYEEFTRGDGGSFATMDSPSVSNENIYYRRFTEDTDTAGPRMSDLNVGAGRLVLDGHTVDSPIQTITITFNEDMTTTGPDSVTNPDNYRLLRNQVEVFGAVVHIEYGLNKASQLAGTLNPVTGEVYVLDPIPTNKWEAVVTLDGDPAKDGVQPLLRTGNFQIEAIAPRPDLGRSGLRDKAGVPLGRTGFVPNGADQVRQFSVAESTRDDDSVTTDPWPAGVDPWTFAEIREAVGMDSDGDHVVVWTQPLGGVDQVYYRIFDADGTPANLDMNGNGVLDPWERNNAPPMPVTTDSDLTDDDQRFGTVALDADGDFVVTWTNYGGESADIYAKRFNADGTSADDPTTLTEDEAVFRVNTYTANEQKWSDVAVDPDGDFIVTWSSYGQEPGGLGDGYGIYARRFDRLGQALGAEFQVNVTAGGDQQFAAVDLDEQGNFVIVWTSDQSGVGGDIIARMFESDGKPKIGPLGGEYPINGYNPGGHTAGNQQYPDVAMTPNGSDFVVVWTSANQDGSADGVFGRAVNVRLLEEVAPLLMSYAYTGPSVDFGFGDTGIASIDVPFDIPINNFRMTDVNVEIGDLRHGQTSDVKITLYHPDNTPVTLVANEPDPFQPSSDFINTLLDDEAADNIVNGYTGPFTGSFRPEGLLSGPGFGLDAYDGKNSSGNWRLVVQDNVDNAVNTGTLNDWTLTLRRTPAMGSIFQVNDTIIGNQQFASLGMDRQGGFTVAWSGNGDQPGEEDQNGSGVFFREYGFGGTPLTPETRANANTQGDQRYASVTSDGTGNYAVVWTGDVPGAPGETDVYRYLSTDFKSVRDVDGPVVASVNLDGTPLFDGDAVDESANITELVVTFSERLSVRDGDAGPDSVLNRSNWVLERNGSQLTGVLQDVEFALNPVTRKYEATLSLDSDLSTAVADGLSTGNYTLVALDTINDYYGYRPGDPFFQGNALDGDFDGTSGTSPSVQGHAGFTFHFTVATEPVRGPEFRINQGEFQSLRQTFSEPIGTGYAREESTRSVAVDHDGDYVAVWTSYGQDDSSDASGAGVYMRMFDRNNEPLTDETLVNTDTQGHQRNASVAMDADGEFVIVWEAENDNVDGSWGIFGQRFSSVGDPLGGQFRVNTTLQNDQLNPSVAMDDFGNFAVVWASKGQSFSYFNDVRVQLFNYRGERIGSELLVNTTGIPGTGAGPGAVDLNPAVAMDDDGNFVVAWDQITAQQNGVTTDSAIRARLFDGTAVAAGPEFPMPSDPGSPGDPDIGRMSRNPQAVMDDEGGFIIVWESWVDAPDASYSVFFEQFDATATSVADGLAGHMIAGEQVNASVAVDADGDFAVVWNGQGVRPDPLAPGDPNLVTQRDDEGVFIRSFHSGAADASVQSRVNITEMGIQQFGSIGMEPDGDMIVTWSGAGVGDSHGIFGRRYDEPTDTAGPRVSDLTRITGERIEFGAQLTQELTHLVVVFDEEMMQLTADSVLNPQNYSLLKDGVELVGGISSIGFDLNPATNKWEAVLELDGNGVQPGLEPLGDGHYEIVVSGELRDVVGNPMGRTGVNPGGLDFSGQFDIVVLGGREILVNDEAAGDQITRVPVPDGIEHSPQAVAGDADGEYVAVWTDTTPGQEGVYAKVYNDLRWFDTSGGRVSTGPVPDKDVLVTGNPTAVFASVARDADGDFVVTWSQNDGTSGSPDWNVWARRYDATGTPFEEGEFQVNSVSEGTQRYSTVAMDTDGDFVVTWQSDDRFDTLQGRARDGDGYGVYAQRYSPTGAPLGGSNEVQVLTFFNNPVGTFTLRWDGDDDPGTSNVTGPIQATGNPFSVVEQIEAELNNLAGDVNRVEVQAVSLTEVIVHFIDQGASKDQEQIVVASTNFDDPNSSLSTATALEGYRGEFRVNDTTINNQMFPSIAMDTEGNFVITWTSSGQDNDASYETNVYAKKFFSNDAFRYPGDVAGGRGYVWGGTPQQRAGSPLSVSTDDPANHIVNPEAGYDGVVQLTSPLGWTGSGILLSSGRHILTAAHVVDLDNTDGAAVPLPSIDVRFDMSYGPVTMTATDIFMLPNYNDDVTAGYDIAIVVLPDEAPALAERYDIYRGSDELRKVAELVGYGMTGQTVEQFFDGNKRMVNNVFEIYGEAISGMSWADFNAGFGTVAGPPIGTVLGYDFDSGDSQNDMFGALFGIRDTGLGQEEGAAAHGDSGGPAFIDGRVAGVASFVVDYAGTDIDGIPFNISFGSAGFYVRVSAYADWIDMIAQSTGPEFLVNDVPVDPATGLPPVDPVTGDPITTGNQKWSSVAMDADGDFVITWTSVGQDGSPNPYGPGYLGEEGIFAKRYNADGTEIQAIDPATGQPKVHAVTGQAMGEFQVNTGTDGKQQHSQVSMDADGDFMIAWESSRDRGADNFGIYAQRYAANARRNASVFYGPNGEIGGELPINATMEGDQRFPSVALDHTGDAVIVWAGNGVYPYADQDDTQGIFHQRFEKLEDDAGPTVADVVSVVEDGPNMELQHVPDGMVLESQVAQMLVSFGENLYSTLSTLPESITNLDNWVLTRDGDFIRRGVSSVEFGLNQSSVGATPILTGPTNKYEAVITLDGDPDVAGNQPLGPGRYELWIRSYVEDQFNNQLDGNYDGIPGGDFRRTFVIAGAVDGGGGGDDVIGDPDAGDEDHLVHYEETGNQDSPAVASDADGNYVVAWVEYNGVTGESNIMARRFDALGYPTGGEFIVNSYRSGDQLEPDVAMDDFGNFVVTWSGEGEIDQLGTLDTSGVFARVFDAFGQPLDEQFAVNQSGVALPYVQDAPSVAMDSDGDFVISFTSYGQDGDLDGVYARRYDFLGQPKADEFLVNTTWHDRQDHSDVAMDDDGNSVIIWSAYRQTADNSEWGVFGRRYNAAGTALGGEFLINTYTADDQMDAHVAMDANGDFAVTWSSYQQDSSGWGVYARRFNSAASPLGGASRVNETTLHWQHQPDIGMDDAGNYIVTWSSVGQDYFLADDSGVYARVFNADGTDRYTAREFQINVTVAGDQFDPVVAMDADGDFPVVWVGPDGDGNGVFYRHFGVNPPSGGTGGAGYAGGGFYWAGDATTTSPLLQLNGTPGNDVFEFIADATTSSSVVKINGVTQAVPAGVTSIRFDGLDGYDKVIFTGSASDETVELWTDHGQFKADRYTVSVTNIERADAHSGGGTDTALLHDDADGADRAEIKPDYGRLYGAGFDNRVYGYRYVHAYATEGFGDVALLYDDPHTMDTLNSTPEDTKLYSDEFYSRAVSFDYVHGYGTPSSGDVAFLYDDPDTQDTFEVTSDYGKLFGDNFFTRAVSFRYVHAYATVGGGDVGLIHDDAGSQDTFQAWPDRVKLYGDEFFYHAEDFNYIHAYATAGDGDVAILHDDPVTQDRFEAWPDQAKLSGDGFFVRTRSFDYVHAYATPGGNDVALLYDDPNTQDTLEALPQDVRLYGDDFFSLARSFRYVHAYATKGGNDVALLYDDPSTPDTLKTWPHQAKLYGDTFFTRARSFRYVHAYATPGSGDVAYMYDSDGDDVFRAWPDQAKLYGDGFFTRARSFSRVNAYSTSAGYDRAYLYDSALEAYPDHLEATANWALLSNDPLGFAYWVGDFEAVSATSSNDSDTKDIDSDALDFILRADSW